MSLVTTTRSPRARRYINGEHRLVTGHLPAKRRLVTRLPSRSLGGGWSLALAFVGLFLFALLFLALLLSGWLARTGAAGWFARTNLRTTRRGNLSRTEVRSVWCRVGWTPVYGVEVFVRLGVRCANCVLVALSATLVRRLCFCLSSTRRLLRRCCGSCMLRACACCVLGFRAGGCFSPCAFRGSSVGLPLSVRLVERSDRVGVHVTPVCLGLKLRIFSGGLASRELLGRRPLFVRIFRGGFLFRRRLRRHAFWTIKAGATGRRLVLQHRAIDERVGHHGFVHAHDGGVVGESIAVPASAPVTIAEIAVTVIDAAVPTDRRPPITVGRLV